jgi:hypothetical protein
VDGQTIGPDFVELLQGGASRPAATVSVRSPLEIPSGAVFVVVVRGRHLAPGAHELIVKVEFSGLGELEARLKDNLV